MAKSESKSASVTLRGRFSPGTSVRLVRADGPHQLRPRPTDEVVGTETVDKDGVVSFRGKGVDADARYFVVGQQDGGPLEVRARGRVAGDEAEVLEQAPVTTDPQHVGTQRTPLADAPDEILNPVTPMRLTGAPQPFETATKAEYPSGSPAGAAGVEPTTHDAQAATPAEELKGEELDRRAADLDIEGRSDMTADEKRKAIARAEQ